MLFSLSGSENALEIFLEVVALLRVQAPIQTATRLFNLNLQNAIFSYILPSKQSSHYRVP